MNLHTLQTIINHLDAALSLIANVGLGKTSAFDENQRELIHSRARDLITATTQIVQVRVNLPDGMTVLGTTLQDAGRIAAQSKRGKPTHVEWVIPLLQSEEKAFNTAYARETDWRVKATADREKLVTDRGTLDTARTILLELSEQRRKILSAQSFFELPQPIRARLANEQAALQSDLQDMNMKIATHTSMIADIDRRMRSSEEKAKETAKETAKTASAEPPAVLDINAVIERTRPPAELPVEPKTEAKIERWRLEVGRLVPYPQESELPLPPPPAKESELIVTETQGGFTVSTEIQADTAKPRGGLSGHTYAPFRAESSER